jgi:hypothetical protein
MSFFYVHSHNIKLDFVLSVFFPFLTGFDLNAGLEEDEDINLPFQVNEAVLEDHNDNGSVCFLSFSLCPQ